MSTGSAQYVKRLIGDDLGSENFLLGQARLEFTNIPLLRDYGLKTFTYGELALYPTCKGAINSIKDLAKCGRLSFGFGLAIPVNPMINILVYYNAININSMKDADVERKNLFNINLGFF